MSLLFLADEQEDMIDRYLEKGLIPRDGTARSDCVDIQFFPLRQGRIYGFCIAGKFSCNAEFFLQFLLRFGGKWRKSGMCCY